MGKRVSAEEKLALIQACAAGNLRISEAAQKAGVHVSNVYRWISQYHAEGEAAFQGRRRNYSEVVKQQAVKEYLSGEGSLLSISGKYKIRSPALVLDWIRVYDRHNRPNVDTGGTVMPKRRQYTLEERVQIVKEHLEGGKTISELAAEHGLGYRLVYDWVKKYQSKGLPGLEDRRGQRIAAQEPRTLEEELRVRVAQLERENHLLKLERDLLKKVKELERGED